MGNNRLFCLLHFQFLFSLNPQICFFLYKCWLSIFNRLKLYHDNYSARRSHKSLLKWRLPSITNGTKAYNIHSFKNTGMYRAGPDTAGLTRTKCSELWMGCSSEMNLTGSGVLRGATTPVLTWMTRGKDNKEIKRGGSRVRERLHDRQSIIRAKMLTPHCTFTFHQVFAAAHGLKECTGGQPAAHLTPGFPPHRFPAPPWVRPTPQHVHLSPALTFAC